MAGNPVESLKIDFNRCFSLVEGLIFEGMAGNPVESLKIEFSGV